MKYLFFRIEEMNGEYEYTHKMTACQKDDTIDTQTYLNDRYTSKFYGDPSSDQEDINCGRIYYFNNDAIQVNLESFEEISEEDYKTLNKYI